jgi:transcription elongation GreA/GreB family factor
VDKAARIEAWRAELAERRAALARSQTDAVQGTRVDGAHRPANRGERAAVTSQGYLSAGIGQRIAELDAALSLLDRIDRGPRQRVATGALVRIDQAGVERQLLVLPGGAGDPHHDVVVLSPEAPLVRALWGAEEGDEASFRGHDVEILEVG